LTRVEITNDFNCAVNPVADTTSLTSLAVRMRMGAASPDSQSSREGGR
jgi:hypothetical protein